MTNEIALWIAGIAVGPSLWLAFHIVSSFKNLKASNRSLRHDCDLLVQMHQNPDKFGFGLGDTNNLIRENMSSMKSVIEDNTTVMKTLVHYIKWFTEQQTGQVPPPPI